MIRVFFKHNFLVFLAIFFAIPVVILGSLTFGNSVNYRHILNNGVETEAEILDHTYRSSLEVNGVPYYRIDFEFVDENGHSHIGTTSETFTYYEITQLCERGIITIKYDPRTFEAIEASYDPSADNGKNVTSILAWVFCGIDAVLWFFVIKTGIKNIRDKKLAENGREYTAKVSYIKSTLIINNVPKYKVFYTWVGENGGTMSGSSSSIYNRDEAEALERAGAIQIKAEGKHSVIITTPDMCQHNHFDNVSDEEANQQRIEQLKCDYCGHNITKEDEYCGNCGAQVNIYK